MEELKPNLERIALAMQREGEAPFEYMKGWWDRIEDGRISYQIRNQDKLDAILEEYGLQEFRNDLYFLAFNYSHQLGLKEFLDWDATRNKAVKKEMVKALNLMLSNDLKLQKVAIKHIHKKESATITDQDVIYIIRQAMLDHYIKYVDQWVGEGIVKAEEISDWGGYMQLVAEDEARRTKQGRKPSNYDKAASIDYLQRYLQLFTGIKAEEGTEISRRQSSFIYKLLKCMKAFPIQHNWKEDAIYNILVRFRKKQRNSPSAYEWAKKFEVKGKNIRQKILKISKTK